MNYVDIILTTDKWLYIGHAWTVTPGDMIGVTNRFGEYVLKEVAAVLTKNSNAEDIAFVENLAGHELKRIEAIYTKGSVVWPEEKEEEHVSE